MKIKPFTGDVGVWARTVLEALTGQLTIRDNAAATALQVVWNSDDGLVLAPMASMPRSIVMLRANLQSDPSTFVSGGSVYWEPQPDGSILVTGIGALTGGVSWDVDLLLVED